MTAHWTSNQPLQADATQHQIVERNHWWVYHQPPDDNTPAVVRTAREYAEARLAATPSSVAAQGTDTEVPGFDKARDIIRQMVDAMRAYEMDVDESPPHRHRMMMEHAEKFLARPSSGAGATVQDDAAALRALVDEMRDEDPCYYDHHDYCQAHRLHPRPCPHERANALFATPPHPGGTE